MILTIELDNLKDISITEYTFMLLLYNNRREEAYRVSDISDSQVKRLIEKEYLTPQVELTRRFSDRYLSGNLKEIAYAEKSIDDFVDKYRSIFPSGNSSSGYPYRGDKQGCIKKMRKFKKSYPKFTDELILSVTRDYVSTHFFKGYSYMQTAAYFIEKDGNSNLAALCEARGNMVKKDGSKKGFEEDLY